MLIILIEGILGIGGMILGTVSGVIVALLLRLRVEGIFKDALLGLFGFAVVQLWSSLAEAIVSMFGLSTLLRSRVDQYIMAGWLVAAALPALRQVVRFVRQRRTGK